MVKEGDYSLESIYGGGYSSLDPTYGNLFTGYRMSAAEIGAPTKPDTANQIQAIGSLLNQGIVPVEIQVLSPETFDQIPKQHFKEIKQEAKLAGSELSMHAPLIEPSGITDRGWSEIDRELAEKQLFDVVKKSVELTDKGGMPITIHASGIPGREYRINKKGEKVIDKLIAINQEDGKLIPIEEERRHYPGGEGDVSEPEIISPEKSLDQINGTQWSDSLSQVIFYKEGADKIISENNILTQHLEEDLKSGKINENDLKGLQKEARGHMINAGVYIQNTHKVVSNLFDKAYKYGTEKERGELKEVSEQFGKDLEKDGTIAGMSFAMQGLIQGLQDVKPKLYVPIEDFAVERSSETFANVAFKAFDKFKEKAPTISIENFFPQTAFSLGKEMDDLITKSKEKFVQKAVKKGYGEGLAKRQADKMIGMTLDVGHLNMARKKGFKDKHLLAEIDQFAKHIKHVHLTDNFGYSDSHLPPGMGNVPIKKIMEKLEKAGIKTNKIIEAGGFVQHFGQSPHPATLQAFGSPIYSMKMAPYWNQTYGLQAGYFSGMGPTLPQENYETFGAGFSQLPMELGGQRPGAAGSRLGGTPLE